MAKWDVLKDGGVTDFILATDSVSADHVLHQSAPMKLVVE